jgi:predicted transcriptional regulator
MVRYALINSLLETTASGGVTRSNLFYKSLLTYKRLRSYMSLSTENKLIEMSSYDDYNSLYSATEKGITLFAII